MEIHVQIAIIIHNDYYQLDEERRAQRDTKAERGNQMKPNLPKYSTGKKRLSMR